MADNILQMFGITKVFPGVTALSDVTMSVRRGEIHAICGENGAGKSTLMKVLSGVYPHGSYQGEIIFDGQECRFSNIRDSERRGIVIIHQELALCPQLSIAENIFLGNERANRGIIDWNRTNYEAAKLLARVELKERPVTPVSDLGVGKQQLVEIAKALAKEVRLLILDEPTAALNDEDSAHLLDLLRGLRDEGITCVIISHKLNEIAAIADTITILRDGRLVEALDFAVDDVTEDRIISAMVGRDLEHRFPPHTPNIGEEVLRIEDWTVHSPSQPERAVVRNASLNLRRGEIVGLAGLMGSGRTELARVLFGIDPVKSGAIRLRGQALNLSGPQDAIDAGIALIPEDRRAQGLVLEHSVRDNLTLPLLDRMSRGPLLNDRKGRSLARDLIDRFAIKVANPDRPVRLLSGGNQQKVVIAKWLGTEPTLLVMDEPTAGVDIGTKNEILATIRRLADEGMAVVVISSEYPELLAVSDRVVVLREGAVHRVLNRADIPDENHLQLVVQGA